MSVPDSSVLRVPPSSAAPTSGVLAARVSVLMPCYNAEKTVLRALESATAQSLPPLEVVVVDDASTDRSAEVVQGFARCSPVPVRLIRLAHNQGAASARNAGWAECQGQYLAFLDADDSWHPQKLERQAALMDADPGLALCGHGFTVETAGAPQTSFPFVAAVGIRPLPAEELLRRNRLPTPSVMLRREIPERFEDGRRLGEDYLLWLQIVLSGGRAGLIDHPLLQLHKASYGVSGLSADLWPMERAELGVYLQLRQAGLLGHRRWLRASVWSLVKFSRRVVFTRLGLFLGRR